ncbi:MAG: 4Fe-4S binding protein [Promethearchaeota archaeon]
MFPKFKRTIDNNQESVKVQFLTQSQELIHDKTKCVGCGTCGRVCPKGAVYRGPVGASVRLSESDELVTEVYDVSKCAFCGTCVIMCPFTALSLKINGELLKLDEIPLVKQNVVPKLEFEAKKIKNKDGVERIVKQYTSGTIEIVDEECAGGCDTCYDVCPSSAISVPPKSKKGWEKTPNVVVDQDKCVVCGACDNACPTGAVKLKITEVKTSGQYNEPFWPDLVARLKKMRRSSKE